MAMSILRRLSGSEENTSQDPVDMLKEDHKKVKELFDEFEKAEDKRTQMRIAKTAINELKVHAAIEEEIFYPSVESEVDDEEIMNEATQEHHVAHFLIGELEKDLEPEVFHAKFMVLAENVRHHIKEEEGEMLPKIQLDESEMTELGSRMAERKKALMANPDSIGKRSHSTGTGRSGKARSTAKTRSNGRSTSSRTKQRKAS